MAAEQAILRRVDSDNEFVRKRVDLLESWAQSGRCEPWVAVLLAELIRKDGGREGDLSDADFDDVFLSDEMIGIMRDQVDGPWLIYVEQANAERSNNLVMDYLTQLEDAMAQTGS